MKHFQPAHEGGVVTYDDAVGRISNLFNKCNEDTILLPYRELDELDALRFILSCRAEYVYKNNGGK